MIMQMTLYSSDRDNSVMKFIVIFFSVSVKLKENDEVHAYYF